MMSRGKGFPHGAVALARKKAKAARRKATDKRLGTSTRPKARLVDEAHLARVRTLPCMVCEKFGEPQQAVTQAHHLRLLMMGRRSGDERAVPLCKWHHLVEYGPQALHAMGERKFWSHVGIDPFPVASALYRKTLEMRKVARR